MSREGIEYYNFDIKKSTLFISVDISLLYKEDFHYLLVVASILFGQKTAQVADRRELSISRIRLKYKRNRGVVFIAN